VAVRPFKVLPAYIFDVLCPSHVTVNSAPFFQTQSNADLPVLRNCSPL